MAGCLSLLGLTHLRMRLLFASNSLRFQLLFTLTLLRGVFQYLVLLVVG